MGLSWRLVGPDGAGFQHEIEVMAERDGEVIATAGGKGQTTLEIAPGPVTLHLLSQSFDTVVPRPPTEFTARGQVKGEHSYVYTYEVEGVDEWVDPFGEVHTEAVVEVEREELIDRHVITTTVDGDTRTSSAYTSWDAPDDVVFTQTVKTGYALSPDLPEPEAHAVRYSGTRTQELTRDVYAAGRYHVEVVGYVPTGRGLEAGRRLEDYVSARFIGPAGEELGAHIEIDRATELGIEIAVTATEDGGTPVVYGARVVQDG